MPKTASIKVNLANNTLAGNTAAVLAALSAAGLLPASALDADGAMAANSDAKVPSQKATRTYVASVLAGVAKNKGALDCSTNPNYPTALNGDFYRCSVAGKVGGASGVVVDVADLIMCVADNAGGTQAGVGTSWIVGQANIAGITAAGMAMLQAADAEAQSALLDSFFLAIGAQAADVDPAGTDIAAALGGKLDTPPSDGHPYGFKDGAVVRLADSAIYTALFATNVTSIAGWTVTGGTPILDGTDVRFANPGSITALQGCYDFDTGGTVDFSVLTGLLTLAGYAFDGQDLVGTLTLPDSLITIAENVFPDTGFTGPLILPPNLTTIGAYAFKNVPFDYATIPASVTSIGDYVFRYSAFTVLNAYVDASVIEGAGMTLYDSGITTIHARASDGSWTDGSGQTIGGKGSIEVIKDL